jgi:glycine betaine/choline ABC-type transport system substrate-binding protein
MNRFRGAYLLVAALAALATVAAACGSTNTPAPASKGTLTVAGFNFPESSILANLYGEALAHDGYTVNYKLNLGTRKVIAPALQSGQIDLYPGYAASELEYYNNSAGEATADPAATTAKLNTYLSKINAIALTPSAAFDGNAYAVTKATATKYNLTKLSDLTPIAGQLVFGERLRTPFQANAHPRHRRTGNTRRFQERLDPGRPGLQQRRGPQRARAGRAPGRHAHDRRRQRRAGDSHRSRHG